MLTETGIEFLLSNDEDDGRISGSRTCVSKARGNQPSGGGGGGADRADQRDKRVLLTTSVSFNARIVDEARRSFLNRAEHADNKNTLAELCITPIQRYSCSTFQRTTRCCYYSECKPRTRSSRSKQASSERQRNQMQK